MSSISEMICLAFLFSASTISQYGLNRFNSLLSCRQTKVVILCSKNVLIFCTAFFLSKSPGYADMRIRLGINQFEVSVGPQNVLTKVSGKSFAVQR
jgi:hypothetical protein